MYHKYYIMMPFWGKNKRDQEIINRKINNLSYSSRTSNERVNTNMIVSKIVKEYEKFVETKEPKSIFSYIDYFFIKTMQNFYIQIIVLTKLYFFSFYF